MKRTIVYSLASLILSAVFLSGPALADHRDATYRVTITNITKGQFFTPILMATHRSSINMFRAGDTALEELAILAEGGNTEPLRSLLDGLPDLVLDTKTSEGLLGPGESVTLSISSNRRYDRLSFAAMLIPTNDTFVGLSSHPLSYYTDTTTVPAYDAGTEDNDEFCANIPGPVCGGEGYNVAPGEGFIYIGNGINGIGDLDPEAYDWNNPVARVVIRRKR